MPQDVSKLSKYLQNKRRHDSLVSMRSCQEAFEVRIKVATDGRPLRPLDWSTSTIGRHTVFREYQMPSNECLILSLPQHFGSRIPSENLRGWLGAYVRLESVASGKGM